MANLRTRLSLTKAQILTTLGFPQGFFSQYAYTSQVQPVGEAYPEVEALCAASAFADCLQGMRAHRDTFASFGAAPTDPALGRGMFPALDGMAAYALVRQFRPRRIIEVGSGDSTYFLARGVKDNGVGEVTCIDPAPRRDIRPLSVSFEQRLLDNNDAKLAATLDANDILFIDSSHIMLPGMDVDIQFNRMFPRLKKGVLVHLHDVFLPDGYPADWAVRNYSEQNALIGWLLGGYFEILWPGRYVLTRHFDLVREAVPAIDDYLPVAGSIWLRRT